MKGRAAVAVIVLGQFAIGSAALFARAGLDAGMGPVSLAAWRLTLGSLLVLAYSWLFARRGRVPMPERPWVLALAGLLLGAHFATWFASLSYVSIAVSTLLVATCPIWAGLLEAVWLRKAPARAFWLGLALALAGLALVSFRAAPKASGSVALGCALALAGAWAFAVYLLIVQPYQTSIGTARTVSWTYTAAALFMAGAALLGDWPNLVPSGALAWTSVLGMAFLAQGVGHTTLNWALKHMAPSAVGVTTLLEPVFAAALAWPIFGETVSLLQAAGAALVLWGVGVVLAKGRGAAEVRAEAQTAPEAVEHGQGPPASGFF